MLPMPTFPSREWMQEFGAVLAAHPDFERVAGDLEGTYRFVIEPGGPLREEHRYDVRIAAPRSVTLLAEPVADPTLEVRAEHDRWRQLIEGRLDVTMALMLRRVKVRGDLSRLMGSLDSARSLATALAGVETTWLDAEGGPGPAGQE